ncbi:putative AraC-type DNA-binding domain-containing proteins [[Clostridium] ultunense Esp]|nr:putative AraC-type DNA-binding domain-containing proteins [[Clostridium] ultunense Esp]
MHRMIIVDDEAMIRRGLSEKIDWSRWSCQVCGVGANGAEGKMLVDRYRPDIVLTDIKMPAMNGLELAEYVKAHSPETVVILLSGYSDFHFAQEAIRHQVLDYLLKPIEMSDLDPCMSKAVAQVESYKASRQKVERIQSDKRNNEILLESGIFLDLMVNGNRNIELLSKKIDELDIQIKKGMIVVFEVCEISNPEYDKHASLYQFAVNNILHETYGKFQLQTIIVNIDNKSAVVVKFPPDILPAVSHKRAIEATRESVENIEFYLKKRITAGIGDVFSSIDQLHESFQSAFRIVETKRFWGIRDVELRIQVPGSSRNELPKVEPILLEAIKQGDNEAISVLLETYFRKLRESGDRNFSFNGCIRLLIELFKLAPDMLKGQVTRTIKLLTELRTFEEYRVVVSQTVQDICQWFAAERNNGMLEQVRRYIQDHFHDPNVSLQTVADRFQVSVSHLSRLFKKTFGTNFHDYLTSVRIDHAKRLFHDHDQLTVMEVAHRVGFVDSKYFGQVFKRHFHMTPSDYKEWLKTKNCS